VQLGGRGRTVRELPGDHVGNQPLRHRAVDEAEQALLGAGEEAAAAHGEGRLRGRKAAVDEAGEGLCHLGELGEPQVGLAGLPEAQGERGDGLPQVITTQGECPARVG